MSASNLMQIYMKILRFPHRQDKEMILFFRLKLYESYRKVGILTGF